MSGALEVGRQKRCDLCGSYLPYLPYLPYGAEVGLVTCSQSRPGLGEIENV